MTTRRDFLRQLATAIVATQLPDLPEESVEAVYNYLDQSIQSPLDTIRLRVSPYITDRESWFILEEMPEVLWVGPRSLILESMSADVLPIEEDENNEFPRLILGKVLEQ